MVNPLGFVLPAATVGLGSLLIKPKRSFAVPAGDGSGPPQVIIPQATFEEMHHDELEITEHPVEQGAAIADHAYKRPAEVVIRCGWSNSPSKSGGLIGAAVGAAAALGGSAVRSLIGAGANIPAVQSLLQGNDANQIKAIYEKLLRVQESRVLFDVFTGKRVYKNMLFKSLSVETTNKSENALLVTAHCRQVIIVTTQTVSVAINPQAQGDPEKTMPSTDVGKQLMQNASTFVPDLSSISGAMNGLQGNLTSVTSLMDTLPVGELANTVSSAINTLPSALGPMQDALGTALQSLPFPCEIPMIPNPQDLGISIQGALGDATSVLGGGIGGGVNALTDAMNSLPKIIESAQPAIADAIKQLPSVVDQLPSTFSNLQGMLEQTQAQMGNVLNQIPKAFSRAAIPGLQ